MAKLIVVYDACVLYPAPLRDTLMRIGIADLCQARWTEEIHDEWIESLLKNRPDITNERLQRIRADMNESIPDVVISGCEHLIETLKLPDPDDRHVLAAAIHANAQLIITDNKRDFPPETLEKYNLEHCSPDALLSRLYESTPLDVVQVLHEQRANLKRPPRTVDEFLDTLQRSGLGLLVQLVRPRADLL